MKPVKSIDEMVLLMRSRGLDITDEARLRRMLYNDNYYRLSGYFRVFQNDPAGGDNTFKGGTKDSDFIEPYLSDGEMRSMVLRGTAKVELTVRSRFAYLLAQNGGAYTYENPDSYQPVRNRDGEELRVSLLNNMRKWMSMSKEVCIRHYRRNGEPVPIWAAMETMPFDTVSRMLSLHNDTNALRELYRSLGVRTNLRTSSEIIHAMVYLRNLCSHHSRLWHREMVIVPPVTNDMKKAYPAFPYEQKSAGQALLALMYLADKINGDDSYSQELVAYLNKDNGYRDGIEHPLHWE